MKLSKQSYYGLLKDLAETLDKAVQTSEREELTLRKDELQNFTSLVAAVPLGFFDE